MPVAGHTTRKAQSERFEARISTEKKSLCAKAASIRGSSLTEFVIASAVEAAERTIKEAEFLELTRRDRIAFVEGLLKAAAAPNAKLREAAARHAQVFAG